jgi:hypothetical protein
MDQPRVKQTSEEPMAKRPKAAPPTHEEFVFKVGQASVHYGFSLEHRRDSLDPYSEHLSLTFEATCLYPDRFAGRVAKVNVLGQRRLVEEGRTRQPDWAPRAVGSMDADKSQFRLLCALPFDACWATGAAISAGSVTYLLTNGPRLVRGKALITSLIFNGPDFDPADYIG